jgi:nucleoside-diphosphate-sugar epimerase
VKIFVTGAAGLIGGATMRLGRELGHEMVGCDTKPCEDPAVLLGDIGDLELLRRGMAGCQAVMHTASAHSGHLLKGMSHRDFYLTNVAGSDNVFQAALAAGVGRVVFSSSLDILCGTHTAWAASGVLRYTAATPPVPDSVYGLTKLMVEEMGHCYHRTRGLTFAALRYVYVFGSCHTPLRLDPFSLLSRVLVVEDCAAANLAACASDRVVDDVVLIGNESPFSNAEIVQLLGDPAALVEQHFPGTVALLRAAGFAPQSPLWPVCDLTVARQALGWAPRYTYGWFVEQVRQGLRRP